MGRIYDLASKYEHYEILITYDRYSDGIEIRILDKETRRKGGAILTRDQLFAAADKIDDLIEEYIEKVVMELEGKNVD